MDVVLDEWEVCLYVIIPSHRSINLAKAVGGGGGGTNERVTMFMGAIERFVGINSQDPNVSKSYRWLVDIFPFFFINLRYILQYFKNYW